MAGETEFHEDLLAALEPSSFRGAVAGGDLAKEGIEELRTDGLDRRGRAHHCGLLNEDFGLGKFEEGGGHHRLSGEVGIGVLDEGDNLGREGAVDGLDEGFAGAEGGDAQLWLGRAQRFADESDVEGAETFEGPESVETGERIGVGADHGLEGRHD